MVSFAPRGSQKVRPTLPSLSLLREVLFPRTAPSTAVLDTLRGRVAPEGGLWTLERWSFLSSLGLLCRRVGPL